MKCITLKLGQRYSRKVNKKWRLMSKSRSLGRAISWASFSVLSNAFLSILFYFILLSFATRARSTQQHVPISSCGPAMPRYVEGNWRPWRKTLEAWEPFYFNKSRNAVRDYGRFVLLGAIYYALRHIVN